MPRIAVEILQWSIGAPGTHLTMHSEQSAPFPPVRGDPGRVLSARHETHSRQRDGSGHGVSHTVPTCARCTQLHASFCPSFVWALPYRFFF